MLKQGILLSGIVRDHTRRLPDRPPIRCLTTVSENNGTFRFYQLRPGEDRENVWAIVNDRDRCWLSIAIDDWPPPCEPPDEDGRGR
jgi:hypothetical protein